MLKRLLLRTLAHPYITFWVVVIMSGAFVPAYAEKATIRLHVDRAYWGLIKLHVENWEKAYPQSNVRIEITRASAPACAYALAKGKADLVLIPDIIDGLNK